jgi:hypothetical protein
VFTKSIRLTDEEAQELDDFVRESGEVEAAILKRAALRGLREDRVDRALLAYLRGEGTVKAAEIARTPRAAFIDLLADKGIRVLDEPSTLADELDLISRLSGDKRLAEAVALIQKDASIGPAAVGRELAAVAARETRRARRRSGSG